MRVILLSLFFSFVEVNCGKYFRHGRLMGGHLGALIEQSLRDSAPRWHNQILDHFNESDKRTWKQKYFQSIEFYEKGGPVFLSIGGEGAAQEFWMSWGAWIKYADTHNAMLFQLEHRYYGQSRPTEDLSVDNMKYLSSVQALEDISSFITAMNKEVGLPNGTRWIVFGGSYSGSLAAWARARFPDKIFAAVSASSPLIAVADFKEYYKVVADSLNTSSKGCLDAIETAHKQIDLLLKHPTGRKLAGKILKLCTPIDVNRTLDYQNFFTTLTDNYAGVVQYNKDNRYTDRMHLTIDDICDIMTNTQYGAAVQRFAALNRLELDRMGETCLDYSYDNYVKSMANTSWSSIHAEGDRQWIFQSCTEFGFFQTSTLEITKTLFGEFPLSLDMSMCQDIFGPEFTIDMLNAGIANTNKRYGGLDYKAERVVFVHGSIDPWHALGITKSDDERMPAIFIEGTAHCADTYQPRENDLPALTEARKKISSLIGKWLSE